VAGIKSERVAGFTSESLAGIAGIRNSAAVVSKFIQESENLAREANANFIENELSTYKQFFDTVERKPLTDPQRRSCVITEDNNLVLAGAGTGKTSTMIGRAGYLLASNQALPHELLMLAYARKAAEEMQERMDKRIRPLLASGTPTIKTFHALGLEIIGKAEGRRPSLSNLAVQLALKAIDETTRLTRKKASVMILARYNFQFTPEALSRTVINKYNTVHIECMTAHAAKGKEADYVVVIGMGKGKHGFPSEVVTDPLVEFMLPQDEDYAFAEERRLFYVALTRARHRVYLVYNPLQASSFIKELLHDKYPICTTEFHESLQHSAIDEAPCPGCVSGSLIPKHGESGSFIGCNNYPYCRYTELACPQCSYLMARKGRFKICANGTCREIIPICPACGGEMVKRSGPHGPFWGCRNYRQSSAFMCTHTEQQIVFPDAARGRSNP
jgi:ssDNA-binding Zn-finger/Zn-ribbon topoisomerase 1